MLHKTGQYYTAFNRDVETDNTNSNAYGELQTNPNKKLVLVGTNVTSSSNIFKPTVEQSDNEAQPDAPKNNRVWMEQ